MYNNYIIDSCIDNKILCYNTNGKKLLYFTQWDINQIITVSLSMPEGENTVKFYFSYCNEKEAIEVDANINDNQEITAKVPNVLLQKSKDIHIYIHLTNKTSGTTIAHIMFPVHKRPKPIDYEYIDNVDVVYIKDLIKKIELTESRLSSKVEETIKKIENGEFDGKDGEQGPPGKDGTTDYLKLENNPFQPVPEAPNPPELLRVPQDLETGAYVFTADTRCYLNNEIYLAGKGELLYVAIPYPFKNKRAVIYDGNGVKFTNKDTDGYVTIDSSLLNEFEQIYQMLNLMSEWLVPLFNVSPGQAITVENADMANLTLEFSGTDLPTVLPNPNALTIKIGDESVVYDGSSAQTIEIADGNEVAY